MTSDDAPPVSPAPPANGPDGDAAPPADERWFVPFVLIPLGLAAAIVGIVLLANFLLGQTGPRTLDELLAEIQSGGANARKQAAFHLARNFAEQVEENNRRLAAGGEASENPLNASIPRRELVKIERAYENAKGDPETREFLIMTLGLVGDDATAEFLGRQLTEPDEADTDHKRHLWLLLSIGRIGGDAAIAALLGELDRMGRGDADPGVAVALAAAFGNVRSSEATRGLLDLLKAGPAPEGETRPQGGGTSGSAGGWRFVRWTAALNLAKRRKLDPGAADRARPWLRDALSEIAADPGRPEGLRIFKAAPASGALVSNSVDKNREQAAAQVIEALILLEDADALDTLRSMARSEPNLRIRSQALGAVARLEGLPAKSEAR